MNGCGIEGCGGLQGVQIRRRAVWGWNEMVTCGELMQCWMMGQHEIGQIPKDI